MATKPPGGTPPKRRPSLRGAIVEDITQGVPRARAWPRSRGKAKSQAAQKRLDDFRIAQEAANYVAPQMMADLIRATHGTPLLPRDILTSLLFNRLFSFQIDGGRIVKPMSAYKDVQEGLDLITNTPGRTLQRGINGWEGVLGTGGAQFTQIFDGPIPAPASQWVSPDISTFGIIALFMTSCTASANGLRSINLSDDGGSSFINTNGAFRLIGGSGATADVSHFNMHTSTSSGPRSSVLMILGNNIIANPIVYAANIGQTSYARLLSGPITNMRIRNSVGGTLTGNLNNAYIGMIGL